jgi:hypothetical protein
MDPIWWKLIAVVAIGLGAWIAWVTRMARLSTTWPAAPGRVLEVWYQEIHDDDIGDSFVPKIRYAYTVRGRTLVGARLWYRVAPLRDHRESMHALRDINKGDAVEVHYDPARPERSVLFPGTDPGNLLDLLSMVARMVVNLAMRAFVR